MLSPTVSNHAVTVKRKMTPSEYFFSLGKMERMEKTLEKSTYKTAL
jgi:hypothetical protein